MISGKEAQRPLDESVVRKWPEKQQKGKCEAEAHERTRPEDQHQRSRDEQVERQEIEVRCPKVLRPDDGTCDKQYESREDEHRREDDVDARQSEVDNVWMAVVRGHQQERRKERHEREIGKRRLIAPAADDRLEREGVRDSGARHHRGNSHARADRAGIDVAIARRERRHLDLGCDGARPAPEQQYRQADRQQQRDRQQQGKRGLRNYVARAARRREDRLAAHGLRRVYPVAVRIELGDVELEL